MSSLSKLNKAKAKALHAQKMCNEWKRRFYAMREQRDELEAKHIKVMEQHKHLCQRLKEATLKDSDND